MFKQKDLEVLLRDIWKFFRTIVNSVMEYNQEIKFIPVTGKYSIK
jgi:hypothetical protein